MKPIHYFFPGWQLNNCNVTAPHLPQGEDTESLSISALEMVSLSMDDNTECEFFFFFSL